MSDTLTEQTTFAGGSIFILPRFADEATIHASSEAAGREAASVQSLLLSEAWQSTGCAEEYLDFDMGRQRQIKNISMANHNLTVNAEIEICAGWTQGDDTVASGVFPAWRPIWGLGHMRLGEHGIGGYLGQAQAAALYPAGARRCIHLETPAQAIWWRIYFRDPDNPDGYIKIGRISLDYGFATAMGATIGIPMQVTDLSFSDTARGGQTWKSPHKQRYRATYTYRHLSGEDAYDRLYLFFRQIGIAHPFFADFLPSHTNQVKRLQNQLYCQIPDEAMPPLEAAYAERANLQLSIEECL